MTAESAGWRRWAVGSLGVGVLPLLLAGANPLREVVTAHGGIDSTLQVAYLEHALRTLPFAREFWDLPIFWPIRWATVMMDPMLGQAALLRLWWWPAGRWPALDANLVFVLTLAGSFGATAAWARRMGLSVIAAVMAGGVYALGPYAVGHWQHLNQLPTPWIPLSLLAVRALQEGEHPRRWAVVVVAAAVVQLLSGIYLFAAAVVGIVLAVACDPRATRRQWRWFLLVAVLVLLATWGWSIPFEAASQSVRGYQRVASDTGPFQARLFDLRFAPQSHLLPWPGHVITRPALYPGVIWSLLSTLGFWLAWRSGPRPVALLLSGLLVAGTLLAFGRTHPVPGGGELELPFAWLQDHVRPMQALRDPSRFFVLAHLALALSGSMAVHRLLPRHRGWWLVVVLALVDLSPGRAASVRVVPSEADRELLDWLKQQPQPAVWTFSELPCRESEESLLDARATLFAVLSDVPTTGGSTGFVPPSVRDARERLCGLPIEERARGLAAGGARWLVSSREAGTASLGPPQWENEQWKVHSIVQPARAADE